MNYNFRPGGLLRCCLATLEEFMAETEEPPKEGDILHCKYHEDLGGMIFHDHAWEWNTPKDLYR